MTGNSPLVSISKRQNHSHIAAAYPRALQSPLSSSSFLAMPCWRSNTTLRILWIHHTSMMFVWYRPQGPLPEQIHYWKTEQSNTFFEDYIWVSPSHPPKPNCSTAFLLLVKTKISAS